MQKIIELQQRNIGYTLKISRRSRSLRLAIYPGGELIVTAPWFLHSRAIEEFILSKSKWVLDKIDYLISFPKPLKKNNSKLEFKKHKAQALEVAKNKMHFFNKLYGFSWKNICIKNQKTRWGSCSKKGNINFNYKIATLPEKIVDYIIVHELCHLSEFNHSRRFWNLVARTIPDYAIIRKELRKGNYRIG